MREQDETEKLETTGLFDSFYLVVGVLGGAAGGGLGLEGGVVAQQLADGGQVRPQVAGHALHVLDDVGEDRDARVAHLGGARRRRRYRCRARLAAASCWLVG